MVKIENNQVFSTEDKYIHKIGSDTYFKRSTSLPTYNTSDFEEVDEIPPYTKDEYDTKVAELVREKYSESAEFALQRKAINAAFSPSVTDADSVALEEYQAYNTYVNECKLKAKNPELYKKEEIE